MQLFPFKTAFKHYSIAKFHLNQLKAQIVSIEINYLNKLYLYSDHLYNDKNDWSMSKFIMIMDGALLKGIPTMRISSLINIK